MSGAPGTLTVRLSMPPGGTLDPARRAAALANGVARQLVRRATASGHEVFVEVVSGPATTTIATGMAVDPDARLLASLAAMPGVEVVDGDGRAEADRARIV